MQALSRLMIVSALGLALGCGSSSSPSGTGGNKGTGGSGTGGATGGSSGTGGSTGGSSGTGGSADASSGTPDSGTDGAATSDGSSTSDGAASGDGGVTARAVAMVMPTGSGTIAGTVTFEQKGTDVTVTYNLTTCPAGVHGTHIHVGPTCAAADPTMIAGAHWDSPRGDGIFDSGTITCTASNTFMGSYTRSGASATTSWTIGTGAANDIVGHAVVVHGPGGAMERFGCGVITKSP
jgi:Cu/Zn superoxide dismutase